MKPKKTFTPTGVRIALVNVQDNKKMPSGLELPDTASASIITPMAQVLAVGPDVKGIKEGDWVLVHPGIKGTIVRHEGQTVVVVVQHAILGVVCEP